MRAIVLAALALTACTGAESATPELAPYRITVMTYNIHVDNRDVEGTVAAIRTNDADVVCLQEVAPAAAAVLRPLLRDTYPHMLVRRSRYSAVAILSRYPLTPRAFVESSSGWVPGFVVSVAHPAEAIQVVGVHMKPLFLTDDFETSLLEMPRSFRLHASVIRDVWSHVDPSRPLVFAGDFNEGSRGPAVRWLIEDRGMRHAVRPFDRSITWRLVGAPTRIGTCLDHILHSPHYESRGAAVLQIGASDHFPVVATLKRVPRTR